MLSNEVLSQPLEPRNGRGLWSFFVPQDANHDKKQSGRELYERGSSVQVNIMTKRPLPNNRLGCPHLLLMGLVSRSARASALSEISGWLSRYRNLLRCGQVV